MRTGNGKERASTHLSIVVMTLRCTWEHKDPKRQSTKLYYIRIVLQHSPSIRMKSEDINKRIVLGSGKALCENVGNIIVCGNVRCDQVFILDVVTNEMVANIDVFQTSMESGVLGKSDRTVVVAMNGGREWKKGIQVQREVHEARLLLWQHALEPCTQLQHLRGRRSVASLNSALEYPMGAGLEIVGRCSGTACPSPIWKRWYGCHILYTIGISFHLDMFSELIYCCYLLMYTIQG